MNERQPWSGKIIGYLQDRYTDNRIRWGTATEASDSEPVLSCLRRDGLKGLPMAFREAKGIINRKSKYNPTRVLFVGAFEFILNSVGIKMWSNEKGFWES